MHKTAAAILSKNISSQECICPQSIPYTTLAVNEREHLADKLCKTLKKSNRSEMGSVKTKIKSIETRLLELNDRIKCIYEDKCTGRILHLDL